MTYYKTVICNAGLVLYKPERYSNQTVISVKVSVFHNEIQRV